MQRRTHPAHPATFHGMPPIAPVSTHDACLHDASYNLKDYASIPPRVSVPVDTETHTHAQEP